MFLRHDGHHGDASDDGFVVLLESEEVDVDEFAQVLGELPVVRGLLQEFVAVVVVEVYRMPYYAGFLQFSAVFILGGHLEDDVHSVALVQGIHAVDNQAEARLLRVLQRVVGIFIEHVEDDGQLVFVVVADGGGFLVVGFLGGRVFVVVAAGGKGEE